MNQERLLACLEEMEQVALETVTFVANATRESFQTDILMQRAVGMNLLMIGEIAQRILEHHAEFAAEHAEIPWLKIRGMRNRIAHGYFRIDLETVWESAISVVPELLERLQELRSFKAQGE